MTHKKCNKCHCNCHCKDGGLHSHHYDGDLCTCDKCNCKDGDKHRADDLSYENNGGIIKNDTDECESCQ